MNSTNDIIDTIMAHINDPEVQADDDQNSLCDEPIINLRSRLPAFALRHQRSTTPPSPATRKISIREQALMYEPTVGASGLPPGQFGSSSVLVSLMYPSLHPRRAAAVAREPNDEGPMRLHGGNRGTAIIDWEAIDAIFMDLDDILAEDE